MPGQPQLRRGRIVRIAAVVVFAGAVVAACGGVPQPEDVSTCDGLVEVGVHWVESTAAALAGQPIDVVIGDTDIPPELAELRDLGERLDARAAELGCDRSTLAAAIAAEIADLESDDPVVSLVLELVRSG